MQTTDLIILLILLGGMAAYVPVFLCLFFTSVLGFIFFTNLPLLVLAQSLFRAMDNFALVVVLFFILCGNVMTTGSIVHKLIKFANMLVSWLPGGLGMAGVMACAMFGAISGSTVATVVALGGFMIPALLQNGYPEKYTVGLMTTSGNLGIIIPPSISMILWCMVSNVSLEGLFLTGYLPGILITILTCLYTYFIFRKNTTIERLPIPSKAVLWAAFKECFWSLMLPVVIFVGIYSGAFTANEAAVVASVYALIVELFIHRTMKFSDVKKVTVSSAVTSATLLIIVAGATCFGRLLTMENIPNRVTEAVIASVHSPEMFIFVSQVILLIVGMFMETGAAVILLAPILHPALVSLGLHPLHVGLVFVLNLSIGLITPPVGVCLFVACTIARISIETLTKAILPFLLIEVVVLMIVSFLPEIVLIIPRLFGYA